MPLTSGELIKIRLEEARRKKLAEEEVQIAKEQANELKLRKKITLALIVFFSLIVLLFIIVILPLFLKVKFL